MTASPTDSPLTRRALLRLLGAGSLAVVAVSVAACGGDSASGKTVKMTGDMVFEPATLTIKKGQTVTWKNDSNMVHTATADPSKVRDTTVIELPAGAAPWDSGNLNNGQEWSHTFDTPGRYRYVCVPHLVVGMVGEIVVEG